MQPGCWGQLLCTAVTLKPTWSSHASFRSPLDQLTCFGSLLYPPVVPQEALVQKDCPLALHLDLEPAAGAAMRLPNAPLLLLSLLAWRKRLFFLASAVCFLPLPPMLVSSIKKTSNFTLTLCSHAVPDRDKCSLLSAILYRTSLILLRRACL